MMDNRLAHGGNYHWLSEMNSFILYCTETRTPRYPLQLIRPRDIFLDLYMWGLRPSLSFHDLIVSIRPTYRFAIMIRAQPITKIPGSVPSIIFETLIDSQMDGSREETHGREFTL